MYRCYNGCPDSKLQALLDRNAALMERVRLLEPEAHCTYHPADGLFQVHVWGRPISGMFSDRGEALNDALTKLTNKET
jgi:hypothetical protein